MQIDLTANAEAWVRSEVDAGRFPSAEAAVAYAIDMARLSRLRADLAAAEAEGGSFTIDEIRQSLSEHFQQRVRAARSSV